MLHFTLSVNLQKRFIVCIFLFTLINPLHSQLLKSVVYDFDGQDIGQNNLPEGDYATGDLTYEISASPLPPADMIGDRVLKLSLNWSAGSGSFGRGISRYIEFNPAADHFNFYIYNPSSNNQDALVDVILTDDDNQDHVFNSADDDEWHKSITVHSSPGWQLVVVPLNQLADANPGGNNSFDISFTQNKGMLLMAEIKFLQQNTSVSNATFYIDMICFSEGSLPTGSSNLDLPDKNPGDYCLLGAFNQENTGQEDQIPSHFESMFPGGSGKKIRYVNYFHDWSVDGSTIANHLPGSEVQNLLTNGYTPVITWEPMFKGYARLDPVQPRLSNIINGDYNTYIDAFANALKTLNDTVIIRFMHEFEGDWYSWSLSQNNQDPGQYATAYRMVVDRFRQLGATKVKWMWCVNSDYAPYESYNWVVNAYPGNSYIDIVASDIYNNHFPANSPFWKSFRMQTAETYYYLSTYFPQKPLFICEVGCRERLSFENNSSQSKGAWFERMDKELQSNYHKVRGLIFFNASPDQNWLVNSSPYALQSLTDNVWNDPYYFSSNMIALHELQQTKGTLMIYPNPAKGMVTINYPKTNSTVNLKMVNALGQIVYAGQFTDLQEALSVQIDAGTFAPGIYVVSVTANQQELPEKTSNTESRRIVIY